MESFVDLSYRGLSLGRRVKLTQVRPTTGYLETPAPMPVGTSINIATDEGLSIDAVVTSVHEQVGGTDAAAGMTVLPALAGAAGEWWSQRAMSAVAVPDEPPGGRTVAMSSVSVPDEIEPSTSVPTGMAYAVVDDGQSTTMMDAVDPVALGLVDEASDADASKSSPNLTGSAKKKRKKGR